VTATVVFLSQANPEQQTVSLNIQGKYSEDLFSTRLMGCPMLPLLAPNRTSKVKQKKNTMLETD